MSEAKLISPMLDNFAIGSSISEHDGVRCYPAMENDTDGKYIVKVISIPASQTQLDALLLTGAYSSKEAAMAYFKELSDNLMEEVNTLGTLSQLEGFLPVKKAQCVPMDDSCGYEVYLLSPYRRTLAKQFIKHPLTQLQAINMGLDLCAALAVARRSGYLYVALKPNNVYLTENDKFRIGDLGFIKLDSLKYASLPQQYRSAYIAPEITDAFSSLNDTLDIYALGLILYQTYNNGALPFDSDSAPEEEFPAPAYADYELSEIILKACAPNPADRWHDPIEMGQALIGYMQRNGVNDDPIVPPPVEESTETVQEDPEIPPDAHEETDDTTQTEEPSQIEAEPVSELEEELQEDSAVEIQDTEEDMQDTSEPEEPLEAEDSSEDLSLTEEDSDEELNISYDEVSDEVSEILAQADELVSHPVPEPAVAPDAVEVKLPEPEEEEVQELDQDSESEEIPQEEPLEDTIEEVEKSKHHWVRNSLIVLAVLALIAAGLYFYKFYYLLPVNDIQLEGAEDKLTVYVDSEIDESILSVVCVDTYGTETRAEVHNGAAVFTDLVPDTGYTVNVVANGFHKVVGATSTAYSTPVQTNIVQCTAVTGSESGSVILSFTVEGPDSSQWQVTYSADGEEEQAVTFPSHMVTVTGLTVGSEYTFRIAPEDDLYVTGTQEIKYTASDLVYAENLAIISNEDGKLTASWNAPEGANIENWTVRCYNTEIYNETQIISDTTATFENLDSALDYTVEVTAAGMSVAQRTYVSKNAITFHNVQTELTAEGDLMITWETSHPIPENGWVVNYSIDGVNQEALTCSENKAVISPAVPGATYTFSVQDVEDSMVLGFANEYKMPEVTPFSVTYEDLTVTADKISFNMCKRPKRKNWNRYHVSDSDYRDTFEPGQQAAFVAKIHAKYGESTDSIVTNFVVRKEDGTFVSVDSSVCTWEEMWHRGYSEMNIPRMPTESGKYTISVYFNGALANEQTFAIK